MVLEMYFQQTVDSMESLRTLKIGQKARVAMVLAEGELGRRIRDMGLVPGVELEVVGKAPLRDPMAVRLAGFTLSLRNSEADFIKIESCPETPQEISQETGTDAP